MADTDLLTLDEALRAVNLPADGGEHDAELAQWVSGISEQIDTICGPVVARTVTEYHSATSGTIFLTTTPVLTVTSVTEYTSAGAGTVLTAEDHDTKPSNGYLLDADGHLARLYRRAGGYAFPWATGDRNIAVVFTAGRVATTALVPLRFKLAAARILAVQWAAYAPAWARTGGFVGADNEFGPVPSIESMIYSELRSEIPYVVT